MYMYIYICIYIYIYIYIYVCMGKFGPRAPACPANSPAHLPAKKRETRRGAMGLRVE